MRYIVIMDGPRADGCVVEATEDELQQDGFWQDVERGRHGKLMPAGTTRADADAELQAWLVSIDA